MKEKKEEQGGGGRRRVIYTQMGDFESAKRADIHLSATVTASRHWTEAKQKGHTTLQTIASSCNYWKLWLDWEPGASVTGSLCVAVSACRQKGK